MQSFEAEMPNFAVAAVAPLRTRDVEALKAALDAVTPPFEAALAAELLALGFAHEDKGVRKKAMDLAAKQVPEAPAFKAAYKSLATAEEHVIDERVRTFAHPMRLDVAKALLWHRRMCASIPFEEDAPTRSAILDVMIENARREGETSISFSEVWWHWSEDDDDGWSGTLRLEKLPDGLFRDLTARRATHAFDGITIHGGALTDLPDDLAEAAPWLTSLSLATNPFEKLPDVLWKLENLVSLTLLGTQLTDIPDDIARLTKLRELDIGNMKRMKEIPAAVCKLDKLERLRIGNGSICKIPDGIVGMTGLRELEMRSTQIATLPAGMARLPNLKLVEASAELGDDAVNELTAAGIKVDRTRW